MSREQVITNGQRRQAGRQAGWLDAGPNFTWCTDSLGGGGDGVIPSSVVCHSF